MLSFSSMQEFFADEKRSAELPKIKILATGGTIAGIGASSTKMSGYIPGVIGVEELIGAVPQIKKYAEVSCEQVANIGSYAMTVDIWLKLANRVNDLLLAENFDGVVITHGTDTLEETAYFLNLVVKSAKPVVLVGAMRPATAISADGPANLFNAVRLAANVQSCARGVLVAMNEQINGARDVTKTDTTHVETFKSPGVGCLGVIKDGEAAFYRLSTRLHTLNCEFDVSSLGRLPRVDIVYAHVHGDRVMADAALSAGAGGIVHAGMGNGNMASLTEQALLEARQKGVVVVRSSRVGSGVVTRLRKDAQRGFVTADNLSPQKARVLLMLALTKTNDVERIQQMFDKY